MATARNRSTPSRFLRFQVSVDKIPLADVDQRPDRSIRKRREDLNVSCEMVGVRLHRVDIDVHVDAERIGDPIACSPGRNIEIPPRQPDHRGGTRRRAGTRIQADLRLHPMVRSMRAARASPDRFRDGAATPSLRARRRSFAPASNRGSTRRDFARCVESDLHSPARDRADRGAATLRSRRTASSHAAQHASCPAELPRRDVSRLGDGDPQYEVPIAVAVRGWQGLWCRFEHDIGLAELPFAGPRR